MKNTYIIILAVFLTVTVGANAQKLDGSVEAANVNITNTESSVMLEMILQVNDDAVTKCQSVAIVPTLVGSSQSADFPYVLVNGRKAKNIYKRRDKFGFTELRENPPYQVVNMDKKLVGGTTIAYSAEIPAAAWTSSASLKLGILLLSCAGERQYYAIETTSSVTTPAPVIVIQQEPTQPVVVAEPAQPTIIAEPEPIHTAHSSNSCAYIDFPVDSYEISFYYGRNPREITEMRRTFDHIKNTPGAVITELEITGYASPEDRYTKNERLAYDRTLSVAKYLQSLYGISMRDTKISAVAEDWVKLRELVEASNIAHKREIIQIIDSSDHPDAKESKLRRLAGGGPWKTMINTMFPQLRRVEYKVSYIIR